MLAAEMGAALESTFKEEARRAPRERVMLSARLSYQGGSVSIPCVVSQISTSGVRISVSADVVLAQTMQLDIPQRHVSAEVRLVWRRAGMAALAYEATSPAPKAAPRTKNADGLEEENRRLRELVLQLEQRIKHMQEGF